MLFDWSIHSLKYTLFIFHEWLTELSFQTESFLPSKDNFFFSKVINDSAIFSDFGILSKNMLIIWPEACIKLSFIFNQILQFWSVGGIFDLSIRCHCWIKVRSFKVRLLYLTSSKVASWRNGFYLNFRLMRSTRNLVRLWIFASHPISHPCRRLKRRESLGKKKPKELSYLSNVW